MPPDGLYVTVEDYASNTAGYVLTSLAAGTFHPTALHLLKDVGSGDWYREAVDYAVTGGLMECDGEGCFQPTRSASRMEIVTALYRANGSPASGISEAGLPFTDTAMLADCLDALCWAYDREIVSGRSDGAFDGAAGVTRQELAVMLRRSAGQTDPAASLPAFSDAGTIADWARDAVAWCVDMGLLQGSGGRLNPTANVTRAETAQILQGYIEGI